nr:MAG TPA: hypothetical protein [Caudoviricetes sp.]
MTTVMLTSDETTLELIVIAKWFLAPRTEGQKEHLAT